MRFLGFAVPVISEGLDGQRGLQRESGCCYCQNIKIESSWLHNEGCSGWQTAQTLLLLVVSLVWHVVSGGATPHSGAISTSISMAVFLESQVDPLAIMEKRGFTTDRAAVGVVIEQTDRKGGCRPEKTSNDVEV